MNRPNTEIKRWGIAVVQSLTSKDKKTGEELYNDVLRYKCYCKKESYSSFHNVTSIEEFYSAIKEIEKSLLEGDILTLQIESHGCEDGIVLSDGEILKWRKFYDMIRPLNIKIDHLLFVAMAMCQSIAMISTINLEKRAPYRAFICTTRDVTSDEIYRGFLAFYKYYFNLLDIPKSLKAIQDETKDKYGKSPFQVLSAESVFEETLDSSRDISDLVIKQLERLNIPITEDNMSCMYNKICKILTHLHEQYYEYYNFKDLY